MQTNSFDNNLRESFISGSGRRFASDAKGDFHYTSFETKNLLRSYSPEASSPLLYRKASFVELEPHAVFSRDRLWVSFNIVSGTTGHHYVLKDIIELLRAIDNHDTVSYGKHLEFTHDISAFSDTSAKIIEFLFAYFRDHQLRDNSISLVQRGSISYTYAKGHAKQIELFGHEIDDFFEILSEIRFLNTDFRARYTEERLLEISPVFPPIDLHIEKDKNGITFESGSFTMFEGYSHIYFERRRKLHRFPRESAKEILPFLRFLSARRTENELFISEKDLTLFSTGLFPVLEQFFNVSCDGFEPAKYAPDLPTFRIYLDLPDPFTLTCALQAVYFEGTYQETIYNIFEDKGKEPDATGLLKASTQVKRSLYLENQAAKAVSQHFDRLDEEKGLLILEGDDSSVDRIYSFIADDIAVLSRIGDVYLSDSLKQVRITSEPSVSLGVSVVSDLLQLSIVPLNMTADELNEILTRYDRKKKYYRLSSGDILRLAGDEMELLYSLKDGLGLTSKEILEGHAAVPKYRALFLDELSLRSQEYEHTRLIRGGDFKELASSFSMDGDYDVPVPESLKDVLRDYQKTGYRWLSLLKKNSFGGILADDMGLGKTLQVLSFLLFQKEEAKKKGVKNRCSLIVCPASLVYNWQHEIRKFTRGLNCELAVGIKPDRQRITSEIDEEETDVIITSYDLLRRDIDLYKYLSFECMIIDEAQFIKNPSTQVAKAVKSVSASFKVALTGTPIENRLSELWSIFDSCMPGYLFSYKKFRELLEVPVVQDKDSSAMDRLRRMISPFVLRRLKKDVLTDLPDKLEENIVTAMTEGQKKLYDAHLQKVKLLVSSKDENEIKKDRIMILSELTRLRQLCCDPGLIYDKYDGGSAKADLCIEMIKSAAESGHKVLLFSQFTSMLERLTLLLREAGIKYHLLTGSTRKEDRIKMVDAFQEDDTNVFCISLKAGGTGLNLTAADIVIHYDHWWNLAVENQATDRAHRIGQKNVVTVYRIIMKDSIEERIIELQGKKKELADQLLDSDALKSPSLTKEELLELLG